MVTEFLRADVNPTHLNMDLSKFFWYMMYIEYDLAKIGSLVGGFKASMTMFLGGDARNQLTFVHHSGQKEMMPMADIRDPSELSKAAREVNPFLAPKSGPAPAAPVFPVPSNGQKRPIPARAPPGPISQVPLNGQNVPKSDPAPAAPISQVPSNGQNPGAKTPKPAPRPVPPEEVAAQEAVQAFLKKGPSLQNATNDFFRKSRGSHRRR